MPSLTRQAERCLLLEKLECIDFRLYDVKHVAHDVKEEQDIIQNPSLFLEEPVLFHQMFREVPVHLPVNGFYLLLNHLKAIFPILSKQEGVNVLQGDSLLCFGLRSRGGNEQTYSQA